MGEICGGGSVALKIAGLPILRCLLACWGERSRRIFRRPQGPFEDAAVASVCRLHQRSTPRLTLSNPGDPARLPATSAATAMKAAGQSPTGKTPVGAR